MNANNESPAALLPCPLCGSSVHVKSTDGLSSILCESPSTCIGSGLGFMFIDEQRDTAIEAWNRRASTAPVASESRGSVPEQRLAAMVKWLEANQPDVFRRGLWDAIAAPTPPAVASGEPTAEQWRKLVDDLATDLENEIENRRTGELPRRIERDLEIVREARRMLAASPTPPAVSNGEPPDWAIAKAFRKNADTYLECGLAAENEKHDFIDDVLDDARELARSAAAKGEGQEKPR